MEEIIIENKNVPHIWSDVRYMYEEDHIFLSEY